jgi:O-antigen ligase
MHWLLAAAIALIGLILAPGLSFYFDVTPKLVILLLAVACAWTWPRPSLRNPLWMLTILSALSLALTTHTSLGLWGTAWRRYGAITQVAIVLLALALSTQSARILPILRVITAAGAITTAYGIAQYFGFDPILPASAYHVGEGVWTIVRPPSTLGYVSYFATWLVFIVFLSLAIPGRLAIAISALATLALILTGTRAAMLGTAVGFAVWLYWRGLRLPRRALLAGAATILAGAAFVLSPAGAPLRSRTRWFAEDPWGGARPLLWRDSARMALARPFTGHGTEVFTAAFPRYESAALARAYPDFAHESPHNIFLDAAVSQGVAGLLLLGAFCVVGFRAAWRARAKHPRTSAALAGALAAGIVAQQFTVFTIPTAVLFFATIALAAGLADPPGVWGPRLPLALPLIIAAAYYSFNDHALLRTRRALEANDLSVPAPSAAGIWYSRAVLNAAQKSPDVRQRLHAVQEATAAARLASRTAEDPFNAWYNLAGILAAQNDATGTEDALRAAIAARPNWFKPHWTLAQLLLMEHRTEEAKLEAVRAADLDGGKHPEVAATLLRLQK